MPTEARPWRGADSSAPDQKKVDAPESLPGGREEGGVAARGSEARRGPRRRRFTAAERCELWVCGPAAYLVLKALAFRSRRENKDAYDLFYVLQGHGDGPRTVAESFRPLLDDPAARDALGILEADFTTPDSVGAMRVAAFLARQGDATFLADVAGFVRELARQCGDER